MRQDWRFTEPVIQEGGVLNLRYVHGEGMGAYMYELIISFDRMEVCARIRLRMFGVPVWSDFASVEGFSLQETLIWAEEVLDKIYDDMDCYNNKGRQRIGVKDEYGKEIYVGDVVYGAVMNYFGVEDWAYNIEIINENGEFKARVIESGYTSPIDDENLEFIRVVGNVNDNPELLKRDEAIQD